MKKLFCYFTLGWLALHTPILPAADIQIGHSWSDGETVSAALLNNSINGATILPNFISDKTNTVPAPVDSFVFFQVSGGVLKRCTLSSLLASAYAGATFTGTTSISEALSVTGVITPTQIAANTDNYAPTGFATATTLRLSTDASRTITGLAGGTAGRLIIIHNVGSFDIVLADENTSSTSTNRFALTHAITIPTDGVRALQYDSTTARWRAIDARPGLKNYLQFVNPSRVDGTGAVMQATTTANYFGQAKFSNSLGYTANWAEYRFIVPQDLDTAVDLRGWIKFQLSGADTGKHYYALFVTDVADSAAYEGSVSTQGDFFFLGDASGASGDVETVGPVTLTGWRALLTPGHLMVMRLVRAGNDGTNDTSTVDSYSGPIVIEYTSTQE